MRDNFLKILRMIKRFFISFLIILVLIYVGTGIYFYNKSFKDKIVTVRPKETTSFTQPDLVVLKEIYNDFEKENNESGNSEKAFSGKRSYKMIPEIEYGAEVVQSFSEIPSLIDLRQIEISFKNLNLIVEDGTSWVLELDDKDGKIIGWYSAFLPATLNVWENCTFHFSIKTVFLNKSNRIKTYVWNKNKGSFFIDDLSVRFLGINKETNTFFSPLNQSSFFYDLENDSSLEMTENISYDVCHSGKRSSFVNGKNEYSVTICKKLIQVMNDTIRTVGASVWLYPLNNSPECSLVFEVRNSQDEQIYWSGKSTAKMNLKAKCWQKLNASFNFAPEDYRKFNPDDRLCIYVFNNNNSKVYADDFEISFGGISDQRGIQNYVDMNEIDPTPYQFDHYHPPFRRSYLQHTDIGNENSQFLINSDSFHSGNIQQDQFVGTGIFTGLADGKDELLVISDTQIELFYYCNDNKHFVLGGNISIDKNKFSKALFVTGDFNGDSKNELLVTTGNSTSMFNFSSDTKQKCMNNPQGLTMNLIWSGNLIVENAKLFAANFSGEKHDEILFAGANGRCIIKKFNGKDWIVLSNDVIPQLVSEKLSTQVFGKFNSLTKDAVLFVTSEKNKTHCSLYQLDGHHLQMKTISNHEKVDNIFTPDEILYPIKVKGKIYNDILAFKDQWRFELKYITFDSQGFYISSVPEFNGYISDQNPKYYEFPRFVSGCFTGTETELLCILRNCADNNFDGNHCIRYDSIPGLSNTIQLYNFSR